MYRRLLVALAVVCMCIGVAAAAHPQGVGLGLMAGEPDGLSLKVWTGRHIALDAGLGYSWWGYSALQIHGDVLFHSHSLVQSADGYLPLYMGVGARVKLNGPGDDYPLRAGLRIPFGLEYVFAAVPFGLFFEVVPGFDVTPAPANGFSWNSAIGFRYYFNGLAQD
jgi:hypothetical protein